MSKGTVISCPGRSMTLPLDIPCCGPLPCILPVVDAAGFGSATPLLREMSSNPSEIDSAVRYFKASTGRKSSSHFIPPNCTDHSYRSLPPISIEGGMPLFSSWVRRSTSSLPMHRSASAVKACRIPSRLDGAMSTGRTMMLRSAGPAPPFPPAETDFEVGEEGGNMDHREDCLCCCCSA